MAVEELHIVAQERPKIDKVGFMKSFRRAIHFEELDKDLVVLADTVGLQRRLPSGELEKYGPKMEQDRIKSGYNEAASYGIGRIVDQEFVAVISNWDFMGGTAGAVVTEKIVKATKLAIKRKIPLVFACSTGGQRMQEGPAALDNMETVSFALDEFLVQTDDSGEAKQEQISQPYVFIVVGDVWGGLTAGAEAKADVVAGMAGSNNGFAGRGAIRAYENEEPPLNSQTVEIAYETHRGVHIILNDQKELVGYLKGLFEQVNGHAKNQHKPKRSSEVSGLNFDQLGYHTPITRPKNAKDIYRKDIAMVFRRIKEPKDRYEQYQNLIGDVTRVDPGFVLYNTFDSFSPIFSDWVYDAIEAYDDEGNPKRARRYLDRQRIIAALASIEDDQLDELLRVMVIGHQPTIYERLWDGKFMLDQHESNPTAWDYRFQIDMTKFAERLGLPIILFPGTPGARPTLADERAGIARVIEDAKKALYRARVFSSTYLLGPGGSGGYQASKGIDRIVLLGETVVSTAEPKSATDFLHPRMETTRDDIVRTANGMRIAAADLFEMGLIHKVINEIPGDPLANALAIREDIIQTHLANKDRPMSEVIKARKERVFDHHPIPTGPRPKSRLERLLHH